MLVNIVQDPNVINSSNLGKKKKKGQNTSIKFYKRIAAPLLLHVSEVWVGNGL